MQSSLGFMALRILSAVMPRGLRAPFPEPPSNVKVPGVFIKNRRRGGSLGHKLVCAALRAMPVYDSNTERNVAKRLRKARRA